MHWQQLLAIGRISFQSDLRSQSTIERWHTVMDIFGHMSCMPSGRFAIFSGGYVLKCDKAITPNPGWVSTAVDLIV